MFDLKPYETKGFIIRTCKSSDLDKIDVRCKVKKYQAGQKCKSILRNAKTVIVIGSVITKEMDVVKKGILGDDFPCYKESRAKAKEIANALIKDGHSAAVTVGVSIKNACVGVFTALLI